MAYLSCDSKVIAQRTSIVQLDLFGLQIKIGGHLGKGREREKGREINTHVSVRLFSPTTMSSSCFGTPNLSTATNAGVSSDP